ncbi:MAG: acyltransferase [Pseudomonadota bacterium]
MAIQVACAAPSPLSALRDYLAMKRSPSALAELDGLRAIAILLVVARHAAQPFYAETQTIVPIAGWDIAIPMLNGWMGVELFFVLSGFLIAKHLLGLRQAPERVALGPYLAKRALRIVPAYFAVLLIVAAGLVPLYEVEQQRLTGRVVYHLLFLQDYLPADIVVVFWSLGVEEKFYLLAPLILGAALWLRDPRAQLAFVSLLVLLGPLARFTSDVVHPEVEDYGPFFLMFRAPFHACIDPLMMGVLCALLYHYRARFSWVQQPAVAKFVLWFGVLLLGWFLLSHRLMAEIGWFDKVPQPLLIALAAGAVLYGVLMWGGPLPLLRGLALLVLARLSYSLYLVHMPLIPGVIWMVEHPLGLAGASLGLRFAVFLPLFAAASMLAALVLHYVVEKPFLLLKDRF